MLRLALMAVMCNFVVDRITAGSIEYTYNGLKGFEFWKDLSGGENCGGDAQSPINVDPLLAGKEEKTPLLFGSAFDIPIEGELKNNGHTVVFSPDSSNAPELTVTGGILGDDEYRLLQFHFHWGCNAEQGSEHTINRKRFPLEMHLVTYNNDKYPGGNGAVGGEDGLAVLTVMFEQDPYNGDAKFLEGFRSHPTLDENLIEGLKDIPDKDSYTTVSLTISSMVNLVNGFNTYFTYVGSLTTPGCDEGTRFIISTHFSYATNGHLNLFQNRLPDLCDNFRPVQPLNGRTLTKVTSSREASCGSP